MLSDEMQAHTLYNQHNKQHYMIKSFMTELILQPNFILHHHAYYHMKSLT